MKRIVPLLSLVIGACSASPHREISVYATVDTNMILLSNSAKAYLGTRNIPEGHSPLDTYGQPIINLSDRSMRCFIVSGLTFAVDHADTFTCNGLMFQKRLAKDGTQIVTASCARFKNGRCTAEAAGIPTFEYRYAITPGRGIEWIRFVTNAEGHHIDELRHKSGPFLLH